jgi:hypothetical protein
MTLPGPSQADLSQAALGSLCPRASNHVVRVLKQRIVYFNHGRGKAAASFYARRGVLVELDAAPDTKGAGVFKGRATIAKRLRELHVLGLRLRPMGCPVQLGVEVAAPTGLYVPVPGSDYTFKHPAHDILVFEFNKNGKIAYEWVTGGKGFAH